MSEKETIEQADANESDQSESYDDCSVEADPTEQNNVLQSTALIGSSQSNNLPDDKLAPEDLALFQEELFKNVQDARKKLDEKDEKIKSLKDKIAILEGLLSQAEIPTSDNGKDGLEKKPSKVEHVNESILRDMQRKISEKNREITNLASIIAETQRKLDYYVEQIRKLQQAHEKNGTAQMGIPIIDEKLQTNQKCKSFMTWINQNKWIYFLVLMTLVIASFMSGYLIGHNC